LAIETALKIVAKWHRSRSGHALIRVYDDAGKVIETRGYAGDFKEW